MAAFEEMGVMPEIAKAVEDMDWNLPTDVQNEAIPLILGGGDVLMAAETGSGKTGAFCLPILQIVWETIRDIKEGRGGTASVGAGRTFTKVNAVKWSLSVFDRGSAFAVAEDGLRCQSREEKQWHGCRATKGVYGKGKYYYETLVEDEGLCRIGWSTMQATLDLGTDKFGFGFGGTGKKSNNKQFEDYGGAFGKADAIGCCLDLDKSEIRFFKNGNDLGLAFKIPQQQQGEVFYPAVVLKNAEMKFNFGDESFKYPPPNGYVPICQAPANAVQNNPNNSTAAPAKKSRLEPNAPHALIIEPSRELAEQTLDQIKKFKKHLDAPKIRELLVIGGVPVREQISKLEDGVDIVVGTPGRMEELIFNRALLLSQCRFFVLDEADGLLKAGYTQMINKLHQQIPKITPDGKRLQMIVCSATLHDFEVKKLAGRMMHFPTWVDLKGEDSVPETVHHVVVPVDPRKDLSWQSLLKKIPTDDVHAKDNVRPGSNTPETLSEAVKVLKGEYCVQAIKVLKMDRALIFCRTKIDCDNLETYLNQLGGGPSNPQNPYSCVCLHSDRSPDERKANLETFKQQKVKFLICTDVAARGIDVSGLPFMINITLPDEKSNYVHRIGRVGRAERMGLAVSLVATVPEKVWYHGQWCKSRGRNCWNTNLTTSPSKGCCIWYNETEYLADIEDHLKITIPQITKEMDVPIDEYDGKVVYGKRKFNQDLSVEYHLDQTASSLQELTALEKEAQQIYLNRYYVAKTS